MKIELSHNDVLNLCYPIKEQLYDVALRFNIAPIKLYPIPRGGVAPLYALLTIVESNFCIAETAEEANCFIDDIIDSGTTKQQYQNLYPNKPFIVLIDKTKPDSPYKGQWVVFPWEQSAESGVKEHITRLIQYVGEDSTREGLRETPMRVAKAWQHWCAGYNQKPEDIFKVFGDGAENYDQMVVVKDIPFYSHCEHHMAPFFGTATIAYIPNNKIIGLSKLARLLDIYAKRLQVQERLTCQVADAIVKHLEPVGCGVIIKARHLCMESRGIQQQGHYTITSALRGVMQKEPQVRAEFLDLAR